MYLTISPQKLSQKSTNGIKSFSKIEHQRHFKEINRYVLEDGQKKVQQSFNEDQYLIFPCPEEDQKMVHRCPKEDQNLAHPCSEEDQKMIHRCPKEDQNLVYPCPEEDQKMVHRCPEEGQNLVSNINTYKHINIKKKNKPESEKEVSDFFRSKKWKTVEGQKFFHHYQSIGWKKGGVTPLTDWQAAAESWILRGMELKALEVPSVRMRIRCLIPFATKGKDTLEEKLKFVKRGPIR